MRFSTLSLLSAAFPAFTEAAALGRRQGLELDDPEFDAMLHRSETNGLRNNGMCRIYYNGIQGFKETCSCLPGQAVACYGLNHGLPSRIHSTNTDYQGNEWEAGRCACDPVELVFLGNFIMEVLPLVGQATCMIAMEALKTITTVGLNAIPVGKGMSLGMRMVLSTAKQLSSQAGKDQKDGFSLWMSPCDGPDHMKEDIDNMWEDLVKTAVDGDPDHVQDDLKCEHSACPDVTVENDLLLRVEAETQRQIAERKNRPFAPGTCSFHITQHQKPDPTKDAYKFDVEIRDAEGNDVGSIKDAYAGTYDEREPVGVRSRLPRILMVEAGNVDDDPIRFRYGAQGWSSEDPDRCHFGGYDGGNREGDCNFQCKFA